MAAAVAVRRRALGRYVSEQIETAEVADAATRYDFDGYGCVGRLDARRYVAMAVGLTLDWIEHAFNPDWRQFLMLAPYVGDRLDLMWQRRYPERPNAYAVLSGDSRQNTLRILIEAYEATRDRFYLDLFAAVWSRMTAHGTIATTYTAGRPDEPADASQQAGFLGIVADAARAAHHAGWARRCADLVEVTKDFAVVTRRALELNQTLRRARGEHAPEPYGFALLALLTAPIVRVRLSTPTPVARLDIADVTTGATTTISTPDPGTGAATEFDEAVVYMRPGPYRIRTTPPSQPGDASIPIDVAATTTRSAGNDPGGYAQFAIGEQHVRL